MRKRGSSKAQVHDADEQERLTENIIRLKQAFEAVEPFIQNHTAAVCPSCENVCCIDRHSQPYEDDRAVISLMETCCTDKYRIRPRLPDRQASEPCRYLTAGGCILRRWQRPFRCTFYFCDPLLESMKADRPRAYREFVMSLQRLVAAREALISGSGTAAFQTLS